MKNYEIYAEIIFYLDEKRLNGKMLAGGEFTDLNSALIWFDSQIDNKADLFNALSYFVVPLYIGIDQNAVSKKYYREIVSKNNNLKVNWCY